MPKPATAKNTPKQAKIPATSYTRGEFQPQTLNTKKRTVEMVWSTGAAVKRYDWYNDEHYLETLSLEPQAVKLERLNQGAPFLKDHQSGIDNALGVVEKAWLADGKAHARIRFSAREDITGIIDDVKNGILRNISVGYKVNSYEITRTDGEMPVYRAVDWEPMELSLVAIPADYQAQVRHQPESFIHVNIKGEHNMPKPNHKAATPPPAAADDAQRSGQTPAVADDAQRGGQTPDAATTATTVNEDTVAQATRKAIEQERHRVQQIRQFGQMSRCDETLVQQLIDNGTALDQAREQMLEQWSKNVDAQSSRSDLAYTATDETEKRQQAAVDALLSRAGVLPLEERQKVMQGNPYRSYRLLDLAKDSLERAGERATGLSAMEIVGRAFTQSTSDFPVLLENAMHKTLLAGYQTAALTWRRFCKTGQVSDFREWKRYRTGSLGNLDSLNELGEFENKTIPDGESERIQASTRGNLINISRQAIINDDMGYFIGLTSDLSKAAARTIEASVYNLLNSNPTMSDGIALFHASHNNLAATGSVPTTASIDEARQAMAQQTDISGNDYLDIRPSIALAPVSLGGELRVLNDAQYDISKTNNSAKNNDNIYTPNRVRGLFNDIIDSPRVAAPAWYLFADPQEAPVIEVVFLDGNDTPFLDMQEGFSVDGVRYKVRLDFGVGVVDFRGAYKNPGV